MPPSRILALRVAVCAGLAVALLAIFAGIEGPRSALARFALGAFLAQHGMHIVSGELRVGSDRISATNFEIDDDEGRVLSIERLAVDFDWRALFGASDRRYGLRAINVHAPALRIVIRPDGSTNLSTFVRAGGAAAAAPAPSHAVALPLDVDIAVDAGRIDVENPTSYAVPGRWFSLTQIAASGGLHGGVGRGVLHAQFVTPGATSPIGATAAENDALEFAQIKLHANGAVLAPPLDAFVSTPAFVTEGGVADISLSIFDVGFSPPGPRWRLSGVADVRDGRIRVAPLDVPVRDIGGRLSLEAGYLGFDALRGTTASLPTYGRGSIRLLPSVRFAFAVDARGDLHEARRLFAFSREAPLRGPITASVRIDGPLSDVHASGDVSAADGPLRIAAAPLRNARATFYYQNGHVTLPHFEAAYDGARVFSDGDIALAQGGTQARYQAVATASAPANDVPFVANLNRAGTVRALASIDGPADGAQFHAFAQTLGGTGASATIAVGGIIGASAAGAGRILWPHGDLTLRAGTQGPAREQALFVSLIATHAPLHLMPGGAMLPGVTHSFSLPSMDAIVDGVAYLGSPQPLAAANATDDVIAAVDLRARDLVVQGDDLGALAIRAHGNMARVAIDTLTINGRGARVRATGAARIDPQPFNVAGVLGGTASVALAPLAAAMPLPARGSLAGDFEAASSRSGWAAMLQSSGSDAALAGAPLSGVVLLATATTGRPVQFAARAGALRGDIAAFGTAASAHVYGSGIDLAALGLAEVPLDAGTATVIARVVPSGSTPAMTASVALSDGRMRSTPLDGSADLTYSAHVLRATGNIDVAHSRMRVDGTARGVAPGVPLSSMTLDAIASVRDGDLEAMTQPYLPHSLPLTGSLDADVALHGSAAAPVVTGRVTSPAATLRGVTVLDTGGAIAYDHGSFALDNARSQLGNSLLGLSGRYGADGARLDARSAHIDLSDFNNFFEGRYVLDGTGTISLALALAPHSTQANGGASLRDASVLGVPVGDVRFALANFGPDGVHLDLTQSSQIGASELSGDVAFAQHDAVLPDFRRATFRASVKADGVDVGLAARLTGLEDFGLRGMLDAKGSLQGTFARPFADIAFQVRDGAMRTVQLSDVRGHIESDASSVKLRDAIVVAPFGQANANAELQRSGALSGTAHVSVKDLRGVVRLAAPDADVSGAAEADLTLHGDVHRPTFEMALTGKPGEAYGVAYQSLAANATFSKNELEIGDTSVRLANGHGTIALSGSLPLQFAPFGLGPAHHPIALHLNAQKIDVAAFDPLLKQFGTIAGIVDADARVSGTAGSPRLQGSATLRAGGVTSRFQTVPAREVTADVALSQDSITLSHFGGSIGSGKFSGEGKAYVVPAVGLRHTPGVAYYASLHATNVPLDVPGWVSGTVNGDLGLTRSGSTPLFAGSAQLRDGNVPVSAIVQLATTLGDTAGPPPATVPGVPAIQPGHIIVYGGGVYPPGIHVLTPASLATPAPTFFDLPSLNLQLQTQANNVRVRGGPIDLTTDGALDIAGSVRDPQLNGAFRARRGTIAAYGVAFHVERGVLAFNPDQGVLPSLDATASSLINGDRVTLEVSGRVDRLNTVVTSSSGQTPEQILATILSGSTAGPLTGGVTQQTLTESAQRLLGAELTRNILAPFSDILAQSLNVEQVSFEFNSLGQIVVEVRKYVSPTVAVLYGSTIQQPITQYWGGSYRVREFTWLELTTTTAPSGLTSYQVSARVTFQ